MIREPLYGYKTFSRAQSIQELWKLCETESIYIQNRDLVLYLFHLSNQPGPYQKIHFITMIRPYGNAKRIGAFQLYWVYGSKMQLVLSIKYSYMDSSDLSFIPDMKYEYAYDACLIGAIDFLQTLLISPMKEAMGNTELRFVFHIPSKFYEEIYPTIRFLNIHTKKKYYTNRTVFCLQSILLDQYFQNRFTIESLNPYNSSVIFDKQRYFNIYLYQKDYLMDTIQSDFYPSSIEETIGTRTFLEFRSPMKDELNKMVEDLTPKDEENL